MRCAVRRRDCISSNRRNDIAAITWRISKSESAATFVANTGDWPRSATQSIPIVFAIGSLVGQAPARRRWPALRQVGRRGPLRGDLAPAVDEGPAAHLDQRMMEGVSKYKERVRATILAPFSFAPPSWGSSRSGRPPCCRSCRSQKLPKRADSRSSRRPAGDWVVIGIVARAIRPIDRSEKTNVCARRVRSNFIITGLARTFACFSSFVP